MSVPYSLESKPASNGFSLRGAVLLALAILLLRVLYLLLVSPYELDGDEAQYWEWSRRLELSYYTKGPGIAWTIYFSRSLFGSTEAGVRLPAALCSSIMMITLARLGYDMAGRGVRGNRVGFYTAALYTLTPAYLFTSQFMTIDMPYFMCAALASLAAYHAVTATRQRRGGWLAWALLGLVIGVGFLYKYTILLMLPGLLIYVLIERKSLRPSGALVMKLLLMLLMFLLAISPVIIWNQREGWPTVSHLLGHVAMPGGDSAVRKSWSYSPMWTLEGIGTQLGALGLPIAALLVLAVKWAWGCRHEDHEAWSFRMLMILLGLPTLMFYLAVSFMAEIEGNWPLAGYIPLLPLAGAGLAEKMPQFREKMCSWLALPEPRPRMGLLTRRPQTAWQAAWSIGLWWGVIAAVFILFAPFARHLPGLDKLSGFARVTGQADYAAELDTLRQSLTTELGQRPEVLAFKYRMTATLAFYLPDRPSLVYCGQHYFGSRRSPYDYFEDTDLTGPELLGKPFILVGQTQERWAKYFQFAEIRVLDSERQWYLGLGYSGPQALQTTQQ